MPIVPGLVFFGNALKRSTWAMAGSWRADDLREQRYEPVGVAQELHTPLTVLKGPLEATPDAVQPASEENLLVAIGRLVEDLRLSGDGRRRAASTSYSHTPYEGLFTQGRSGPPTPRSSG